MAEAQAENVAKPKKKLLIFALIGVVLVVLLAVGGLVAFLMLRSDPATEDAVSEAAHASAKPKQDKKEKNGHPPVFEKLPLFTVNLNSENGEVMQTEIVLEVADAEGQNAIKQVLPKVQAGINKLLSAKTPDEVKTVESREKLESEIKDLVNKTAELESGVLSVNFTSFIVR